MFLDIDKYPVPHYHWYSRSMIIKRKVGRPTKQEDADLSKIRAHVVGQSLGYINRLEKLATKCYGLGMSNPSVYGRELKVAADIYLKLLDVAGIKPRESLINLTNNQNNLVAGTPEHFLHVAQQAQAQKQLAPTTCKVVEPAVE